LAGLSGKYLANKEVPDAIATAICKANIDLPVPPAAIIVATIFFGKNSLMHHSRCGGIKLRKLAAATN